MRDFKIGFQIALLLSLILGSPAVDAGPLRDAFADVLDSEPSLARIESNRDRQIARHDIAKSQLRPQAEMRLNENRIEQETLGNTSKFDGQNYQLTATQTLFNGEALAQVDREGALIDESSLRLQGAKDAMALTLTERYFTVLRAQSRQQVLKSLVDNLRIRMVQANALVQAGKMSQLERVRIESRLAERRSELTAVQQQVREARAALNQLAPDWRPNRNRFDGNLSPPQWPPLLDADALATAARGANVELLGLQRRIEAEKLGLKAVERRRLPVLQFEMSYEDSNVGSNNRQISETVTTVYGIKLSIPLYRGGSLASQQDEQNALVRGAEHDYRVAERELLRRIETALAQFESAQAAFDVENDRVIAQQQAVEVLGRALEQSAISQAEYLDALDNLANAQIARDELLFAGLSGWLSAQIDSGRFTADDLARIDDALRHYVH